MNCLNHFSEDPVYVRKGKYATNTPIKEKGNKNVRGYVRRRLPEPGYPETRYRMFTCLRN